MFPSPIGELHFSICIMDSKGTKYGFRPLSGSYISQFQDPKVAEKRAEKFPSPIGELHFSMK